MNGQMTPTSMPQDLRRALYFIREWVERSEEYRRRMEALEELLSEAMENVRCHLAGIPTDPETGLQVHEGDDNER